MKRLLPILICLFLLSCIKEKPLGGDMQVGDSLPDFEVVMNDGTTVSDDILKGNISVVMFFHSTCPDCQSALPRVQQLYDEYASKGVLFALISREQPAEEIEAYWRAIGLNLPYSAQNSRMVYELFAKTRIPRIYINDKDGIIRHIFTDDPVPAFNELKESLESVIR